MSSFSIHTTDCSPYLTGLFISNGISEDAKTIEDEFTSKNEDKSESITLEKSFVDLQNELNLLLEETTIENWDGYGAKPLIKDSYLEAQKFIHLMSLGMDLPEVSIDPDGEVSFEWYSNTDYKFSISFSGDQLLTYAGIFGLNKMHGTQYFGDELPKVILENISKVYKQI